jgi:1,4-dihydroxy-2-naphthoate polyprenyltransferase
MNVPQEPLLATLAGPSFGRTLKRYWLAMRPPFLSASAAPVVVGTAWGFAASGHIDWPRATLAIIATLLVHASANVLNDVADDESGTDPINAERIYPYTGGSRFIQNRVLTRIQMRRFGLALLSASLLVGLSLAFLAGPVIVALGVFGVALGTLYSLKPVQLAARGLGELTIAITFGVLPFCGAAWLQSGAFDVLACVVALPIAMWVTAILLINEVPDIAADRHAGKRTFPVRFGIDWTRRLYFGLHLVAAITASAAVALNAIHPVTLLASAALMFLASQAARAIRLPLDRGRLTDSIESTLRLHLLGAIALLAGILLTPFDLFSN